VSFAATSSFQRHSRRDERRRRLLTDELCHSDAPPACRVWPEDTLPPRKSEHYADAGFLKRQPGVFDLAPRRLIVLAPCLLAAVAIIAGLEAAYAWMCGRAGRAVFVALDIDAKGSLACWFSTLTLLVAAAAALLVYAVRRHRTDDYRGRYRIWLWAAGCWLLLATDQAASLREAFRDAMTGLTGTPLVGNGALWWVVVYILIFGTVGSRLLMDMRPSPLSIMALVLAAIAHALAMAGRLGWTAVGGNAHEIMFRAGSEMAGNLMLAAAMTLHARYVLLDAEGCGGRLTTGPTDRQLEAEDAESAGDAEESVSSSAPGRRTKIDPPQAAPQPAHKPAPMAAAVASAATSASSSYAGALPSANRKLSKAERRALKERLLHERRERERGSG
jgi:hypothetical protein